MSKRPFNLRVVPAILIGLCALSGDANSAVIIAAEEHESDVTFFWGGAGQSLNLTALTLSGAGISESGINPGVPIFHFFPNGRAIGYAGAITFNSFGDYLEKFVAADIISGSSISIRDFSPGASDIGVNRGYVSGSAYPEGSATFVGQSFSSLGLDSEHGSIVIASWGSGDSFDSVEMNFTVIPEPSSTLLLFLGLGTVISSRRRRHPNLSEERWR